MQIKKILTWLIWVTLGLIMLVPIYLNVNVFFPYIFSKTLVFRILAEVLVLTWLAWLWVAKEKIRIDWLTIFFFAFIAGMFLSSLLGPDFYFSFWSNNERSEGLLLWLHLFAFWLVLRNFIVGRKQWTVLLNLFFAAAQVVAVIGLLQYFNVSFIQGVALGDERVASTVGNAAYLAGFMLFAAYFGLYLLFKNKPKIYWRYYYVIFVLIDLFVMMQTGTRGAFLAFIITAVLFILYNIFNLRNKKIRYSILAAGAILTLLLAMVYANKNSNFVQNSLPLKRLTSISFAERTAQTRLMAWNSAWQGFKDRPILGWGNENYYIVFNKYFDPEIYSHAASRVWFDRAHNIFLDHLATGGLIGFLFYLLLIVGPVWVLWQRGVWPNSWWARLQRQISPEKMARHNLGNQILLLALVAFIIQGLLVFEALVTYLPLLIILAMVGEKYFRPKYAIGGQGIIISILTVYLALFFPMMYFFNYRENKANATVIEALRLQTDDYQAAVDTFVESISYNSSGTQEYRRRLTEYVDGLIQNQLVTPTEAIKLAKTADAQLTARLKENPNDASHLLLMMRHYNSTYFFDANRLFEVKKLGERVKELSPTRPHLYYEMGFADIYLYQYYKNNGDLAAGAAVQQSAVQNFQTALDLNNDVIESYINMIVALLSTDQPEKVRSYLDIMDQMGLDYRREDWLQRLANPAINQKHFDWAIYFLQATLDNFPNNPDNYVRLAVTYEQAGQREQAIATAELIKNFGAEYVQQADGFIARIKSGEFSQ